MEDIKMEKKNKFEAAINYKSIDLDVKKFDFEKRTVEGYGAVWNTVDSYGDVLLSGCCDKSINERGPDATTSRKMIFLYQHNQTDPIGHFVEVKSDDYGLFVKVYIDKIPQGDRVLEQIKSGTLNQLSIGFNYVWDKCDWVENYETDGKIYAEVFVCKEIVLWEVSVVTFGANEFTHFIKSIENTKEKLSQINANFNTAIKVKDDIQLKHLAVQYSNLIEALIEKSADKKSLIKDEPLKKEVEIDAVIESIKKEFKF